jgi:parallel beta-helix repeat protein
MIRKIVAVWVSLAMLFGFVVIVDVVIDITPPVKATTITVDDSGGADYLTLQEGIDAANPGDTVFVYNGTYYENVVVNKTITLTGENKDTTVINGMGKSSVIWIIEEKVNVSGFTVTNSSDLGDSGGFNIDSNFNTIYNNILNNNEYGLYFQPSSHGNNITANNISSNGYCGMRIYASGNNITQNIVSHNSNYGIYLDSSDDNKVSGNVIFQNGLPGLFLNFSENNNVSDNTFSNDGIFIFGDLIDHWNTHDIDTSNMVNGKPVYYWKDQSGGSIPQNSGQVILANCKNIEIADLNLTHTSIGISLGFSSEINISNNNLSNNYEGMYLYYSDDNNITNNIITHNIRNGLYPYYSDFNDFTSNKITSNYGDGVYLIGQGNYFFNNTILSNGGRGIYLDGISNDFVGNTVTLNNLEGFFIYNTWYTDIINNTISYNREGIYLDDHADRNDFFNNKILNNDISGIRIINSADCRIINNNISSNKGNGVHLSSIATQDTNITGNKISNNSGGIYKLTARYSTIKNNEIISNTGTGIWAQASISNHIEDNHIIKNSNGIVLRSSSNSNKILNNNITSNDLDGIYLWITWNVSIGTNNISNNLGKGISISDSSYDHIMNNYIYNNSVGINSDSSSNINISQNDILKCNYGMILDESSSNSIINNNVTKSNNYGIRIIMTSDNNIIKSNNISLNEEIGLQVYRSSYNQIIGNKFTSNGVVLYGQNLEQLNSHTIPDNNIVNDKPLYYYKNCSNFNLNGITAGQLIFANCSNINVSNMFINSTDVAIEVAASTNINLRNNTIVDNYYGIYLCNAFNGNLSDNYINNNRYGIYLTSSMDNHICHNRIINNSFQGYDNLVNNWNGAYPYGGNYWSDYTGVDQYKGPDQDIVGIDGIGDSPYMAIGGFHGMKDYYPLMGPYLEKYRMLKPGWNLISLDLIQISSSLESVLLSIEGKYDAIQWYDVSNYGIWKHFHKLKPSSFNKLQEINHSIGFWIHITQPGDTIFLYKGIQPSSNQSITLHPGWNMVGYPSLSNRTRDNALNNINYGSDVDSIWTFNAATQAWQEIGPSDSFELGRGYWIHSKVTKVWDVPL